MTKLVRSLVRAALGFALAGSAGLVLYGNGVGAQDTASAALPAPRSKPPMPPLLSHVAAIIEADVAETHFTFDDRAGPRTVITLANVSTLAGETPKQDQFSQLGGPLPGGKAVVVFDLPEFSVGSRYIIFLTSEKWQETPVWARLAFRLENFGTRTIVLGADGRAVQQFDDAGMRFGQQQILIQSPTIVGVLSTVNRKPEITEATFDVIHALTRGEFLASAIRVAQTSGAFAKPPSLDADTTLKWNDPHPTFHAAKVSDSHSVERER